MSIEQPLVKPAPTFEDCIDIINTELNKRKSKWRLTAVNWIGWDDIANEIRHHLYIKWDQYKPELNKLPQWINRIISHQITNQLKKYYSNYTRPCLKCAHNQGDDLCYLYGKQCEVCPMYSLWCKRQKRAYDVKLPVSLDSKYAEDNRINQQAIDVDFPLLVPKMHVQMMLSDKLTDKEKQFYQLFYIDEISEDLISEVFNFKSSKEEDRRPGYKTIQKMKNKIYKVAKDVVGEVVD